MRVARTRAKVPDSQLRFLTILSYVLAVGFVLIGVTLIALP
jgi:hypothetical protein